MAARVGLTPDELLGATWSAARLPRYAVHVPGLDVLAGDTHALVGYPSSRLEALAVAMPDCARVDGAPAAARGIADRSTARGAPRCAGPGDH